MGRDDELQRLDRALADVRAGSFRFVLVRGEAGIGKTRLINEFLESRARVSVFHGLCAQMASGELPFGGLAGALRDMLRVEISPDLSAQLAEDLHLARRLSAGNSTRLAKESKRAEQATGLAIAAVSRLLHALAEIEPRAMIIEDVQWSDGSTRDVLLNLARSSPRHVLVLITLRTDEPAAEGITRRFVGEISRTVGFESVALGPLSRHQTAVQLEGILGRVPEAALVRSIHGRGEGIPFYTEELVATGTESTPPEVTDVLLSRFGNVSPGTQHVLRAAATVGRTFGQAMLARVAGVAEVSLEAAIREASEHYLIEPDTPEDGKHSFRHALMHEAVYGTLLATERRRVHAAVADVLEEHLDLEPNAATRLALLANHAHAAGDLPRAARFSVAAGRAAEELHAHHEALNHFERVVNLVESGLVPTGSDLDINQLYEHAAEAASLVMEPDRAVDFAQRALASSDGAVDPVRSGLIYERLGYYYWLSGAHDLSLAAAQRSVQLIPSTPQSVARARALAGLAMVLMVAQDDAAMAVAREAVDVAREVGARREEASALDDLGSALITKGEIDQGLEFLNAAVSVATEHQCFSEAIRAAINISVAYLSDGQYRSAADATATGYELAVWHGLESAYGLGLTDNEIEARLHLGEWGLVDELVERAALFLDGGMPSSSLIAVRLRRTRAVTAIFRGDFDAALADLALAAEAGSAELLPSDLVQASKTDALMAIWTGRAEEARRHVDMGRTVRIGEPSERLRLRQVGLWAEADAVGRQGRQQPGNAAVRTGRADALMAEAREIVADLPDRPHTSRLVRACEAEHRRFLAEIGMARPADVASAWRALAVELHENGQRYDSAFAYWRAAELGLKSRAGRAAAESDLRQATAIALALGARPMIDSLRRLAAVARIALDRQPLSRSDGGLTRRELDVLRLVSEGRTNRQIAARLFISTKTAGLHVSNLLAKLGAANRTEAAAIALRLGLVAHPASQLDAGDRTQPDERQQ